MPRTTRALAATLAAAALLMLGACSSDAPTTGTTPPPAAIEPGTTGTVDVDDRPFALTVPDGYDPQSPVPLVVGLHGFTSHGSELADYLGLPAQAHAQEFLLAVPEGTGSDGAQFWNATNACCDFWGADVDDSTYLAHVIAAVQEQYAVDPARVVAIGHSNGGFMALRLACDHADLVTAVVSIAGAQAQDPTACQPARPVSVLQVHGNADETIAYDGGPNGPGRYYPSAEDTVGAWHTLNGCDAAPADGTPLDLEATLPGAETAVRTWSGCAQGTEVALWTIDSGRHVPAWTADAPEAMVSWLLAHPRQG